jgi:hypothetical protein
MIGAFVGIAFGIVVQVVAVGMLLKNGVSGFNVANVKVRQTLEQSCVIAVCFGAFFYLLSSFMGFWAYHIPHFFE